MTKIAMCLSLGLHKEHPAYRRSLQPQKRTYSTSKLYFLQLFLFLWVISAHLDPDPDPVDQNQCRSMRIRSTTKDECLNFDFFVL